MKRKNKKGSASHYNLVLLSVVIASAFAVASSVIFLAQNQNVAGEAGKNVVATKETLQPDTAKFPWANYPETLKLDSSKTYNIIIANRVMMGDNAKARIVIAKVLDMGTDAHVSDSAYVFESLKMGTDADIGMFYSPPMIPIVGAIRYEEEGEEENFVNHIRYGEDAHEEEKKEEEKHKEHTEIDFKNAVQHIIMLNDELVDAALKQAQYP